jgi:hypothetical protein
LNLDEIISFDDENISLYDINEIGNIRKPKYGLKLNSEVIIILSIRNQMGTD